MANRIINLIKIILTPLIALFFYLFELIIAVEVDSVDFTIKTQFLLFSSISLAIFNRLLVDAASSLR